MSPVRLAAGRPRSGASHLALTIRRATAGDAAALRRLAALDSSHVPSGTVLIAEVGLEPWAAMSVDDGHAVADPFRLAGEVVLLLAERSRQLRSNGGAAPGRRPRRLARARRLRASL
jgi:hypothetical protein